MFMPRVINKKHKSSVEKNPNGSVYIGRPSKWGNPFVIGKDGNRQEVIQKYSDYIKTRQNLIGDIGSLKGKDLICWCAPLPCHGDVLLALANESDNENE